MTSRYQTLTASVVCAAAFFVTSCGNKPATKIDTTDPAQVKVEQVPDTNIIQIEKPERFGVVHVTEKPYFDQLNVNGSVAPDVSLSVPVLSLAGGRAVEIHARLGDHVQKGALLLKIDSPDVSNAISVYQQAVADEVLARKQLERSQILLDKGAIAVKDLEIAQDTEEKAKVTVNTAEKQLRLYGTDPRNPSPVIDIKAPSSGYIVEQNIVSGTAVKSTDNSPNLFTISDLSRIWLICDVYENDLSKVHTGDTADVRLNAYPDRTLKGRVSNIGTVLDPSLRTAKVRLEIPNPNGLMRIGMFATATFHAQNSKMRVEVPASAVIRLHDRDWVFVPLNGNRFKRTTIEAGQTGIDGAQEVLSGLSPGDAVVEKALQLESAASNQ